MKLKKKIINKMHVTDLVNAIIDCTEELNGRNHYIKCESKITSYNPNGTPQNYRIYEPIRDREAERDKKEIKKGLNL